MERITINTPRLTLKSVQPEYVQYLFENYSPNVIQEMLGLNQEILARYEAMYREGMKTSKTSFIYFTIYLENEPIGECGYHTWYLLHDRAEIFYTLNSDLHKRKGYASEFMPHIIKYGFEEMKLNRIEAFTAPYNLISKKVLSKHKFTYEGTAKEHYLYNGVYEDSEMYALLKSEWKSGY